MYTLSMEIACPSMMLRTGLAAAIRTVKSICTFADTSMSIASTMATTFELVACTLYLLALAVLAGLTMKTIVTLALTRTSITRSLIVAYQSKMLGAIL